jgi:hypothetical protein
MRIIKLTPAALRRWKDNVPQLVDNNGVLLRNITQQEDAALVLLMRQAKSQRRSKEQKLLIHLPVGKDPHGPTQPTEVVLKVDYERTGRADTDHKLTVSINGHQYRSGREILAAELLEKYGECQLRHPNGGILKTVRDPRVRRPTHKDSLLVATHPDFCPCKDWGQPHPGTHYPTCQQNRIAPPEHQAPAPPTEDELQKLPPQAFASLARPDGATVVHSRPENVVLDPEPLDSPENCRNACRDWALPPNRSLEPLQHHPTCVFYERYKVKTASEKLYWLVDLQTGQTIRRADRQEWGEAEVNSKRTGAWTVVLDDVTYGVVAQDDLLEELEKKPSPKIAGDTKAVALRA